VFADPVWKMRTMFSGPMSLNTSQQSSVTVPPHEGRFETLT